MAKTGILNTQAGKILATAKTGKPGRQSANIRSSKDLIGLIISRCELVRVDVWWGSRFNVIGKDLLYVE